MYELFNEQDYGLTDEPSWLITKREPAFRSGRSLVFRCHSEADALEILAALNGEDDA